MQLRIGNFNLGDPMEIEATRGEVYNMAWVMPLRFQDEGAKVKLFRFSYKGRNQGDIRIFELDDITDE